MVCRSWENGSRSKPGARSMNSKHCYNNDRSVRVLLSHLVSQCLVNRRTNQTLKIILPPFKDTSHCITSLSKLHCYNAKYQFTQAFEHHGNPLKSLNCEYQQGDLFYSMGPLGKLRWPKLKRRERTGRK